MIETVALFVLAFGAFFLATRIWKKKPAVSASREVSPLDAWAAAETARLVADKLGLDEPTVSRALDGDAEPDTVTALERGTRKVELCVERVPGALGGEAGDVTLEISFEDGSTARARRRAAWNELPGSVRDELTRSGAARVYRPRPFPWQR